MRAPGPGKAGRKAGTKERNANDGSEISAENPGLTAGAGARLSLTPSGLWQGRKGWGLPLGTPGSGSGSRPRWGCGKMEVGKTEKLEARSRLLQGGDVFGKGCGEGGVLGKGRLGSARQWPQG